MIGRKYSHGWEGFPNLPLLCSFSMRRKAAKFKITDEVKHEVPIPLGISLIHITSMAIRKISINPHFPALRSAPMAFSGGSRRR